MCGWIEEKRKRGSGKKKQTLGQELGDAALLCMCQERNDDNGGQGGVDSLPVGLGKTRQTATTVLCSMYCLGMGEVVKLQGPEQRVGKHLRDMGVRARSNRLNSSSGVTAVRAWRGCFEG